MHLYSLTLQQPTAIQHCISGNFSSQKTQDIVVTKGKVLQIMRQDSVNGKLEVMLAQEVFGMIRNIKSFRLPGSWRDYIIMTSDSGRVVIIQYDKEKNQFIKIHQETYGKTGCRRIVPGQYLACDPKGRAFMIGAVEKQKLVYILNRDSENKLTISSPLEAHKSHNVVFDMVGLDVGFDNPMFACLESDYGDEEDNDSTIKTGKVVKNINYYEMDFGLNHVVRKFAEQVPESAHMLIALPSGEQGPGGLIVCCADFLIYKNQQQNIKHIVQYPSRLGSSSQQVFVNCYSTHIQQDMFFYLLQNEFGDLWKLDLKFNKHEVHTVSLSYFDTVPLATSMCILKSECLFIAAELGNHMLYSFIGMGENEKQVSYSNSQLTDQVQYLIRNPINLQVLDELNSLQQISDMKVEDLTGEGNPQIYAICAANERSSLRVLRHGVAITEMAVSQLPGKPVAVWTIKENNNEQLDKYIILSFQSQTLVLSIGEKVVEINDSGLDNNIQTIHVALMEDNGIVQIFQGGIRHIKKEKRIHVWETHGRIVCATSNPRQLAIALQGGEIIYFELDALGQLTQMHQTQLDNHVFCLDIGQLPNERLRSRFLAVGLADSTVRILSLDIETCLQRLSTQVLPATAESTKLIEMDQNMNGQVSNNNNETQLLLHVGLSNGVLLRSVVDNMTGALSDARTRFLGTKPVKLFRIQIRNNNALLSLSSKPWITYSIQNKTNTVPLSSESLDYASGFHSQECPHGLVAIQGKTLRIITPEKIGDIFNQQSLPLKYSPRKLIIHPQNHILCIIESQHKCYPEDQRKEIYKQQVLEYAKTNKIKENAQLIQEALQFSDNINILKAQEGIWASGIRLVEPISLKTIQFLELENNEAAISINICMINNEFMLIVGTIKDYRFSPKQGHSGGYIYSFRFVNSNINEFQQQQQQNQQQFKLELIHKSQMDEPVMAIQSFQGQLLLGVGSALGLYEFGKKKLLKKAELKDLTSPINTIQVSNQRIFVTDIATSFHCFRLKAKEATFHEFCDDILPRWVTATTLLDHHTIVGLDKFQNVFVCRIPFNIDEDGEDDHAIYKFRWETGYLNGALNKMQEIANFFVGDLGTSVLKTSLMSTSNEIILYGTSMGSIGALYPFDSKEDVDFFLHLEMYLRIEQQPLSGREHIMFRSLYGPTKSVIDGDLCEQFNILSYQKQKNLAEDLDRTSNEVIKKLDDIRNRIL